ncbi:MAG: hypothetical protein KGJ41_02735 [Rhodospirillales bacterium]|nr:hypothetical protein [Rhodospirillales bacterium]
MSFSDPFAGALGGGSFRAPRVQLIANGVPVPVPGVIDVEIVTNNHYSADRFRATISASGEFGGLQGLVDQNDIAVEILLSLDGGGSCVSLFTGAVDTVDLEVVRGVVRIEGRDQSAALIESRIEQTFANNTASEIAEILAARHSLAPDVQQTRTPSGRYWQLEHDQITLNQFSRATTEWDLLVVLAQFEGFDVWVSDQTLHFRPPVASPVPAAMLRPVDTLAGPANVSSIRLERALTLGGDIEVAVKSWNSRQAMSVVQTVGRSVAGRTGRRGQSYVYVVPNLTPDDAQKYAQERLLELTQHERVLVAEMPGELTILPRMMVGLEGSGTGFDQLYWVDRVERRVSIAGGFRQIVRAKNVNLAP